MTRREYVNAVLNHKDTGMIPISIGSNNCDGFTKFSKDAYERFLGYEITDYNITSKVMGSVATPPKILELSECDFRTVYLKGPENVHVTEYEDGSYLDEYGVLMKPSEYYYDPVTRPLGGDITVKDIETYPWPEMATPGRVAGLREEAIKLRGNTDYAVCVDIPCEGPFEFSLWMRGWEDFLTDFYEQPEVAEALMNKITEIDLQVWDLLLTEVGDYVDVVCQGDDLGMQDRSIVSAEIYNKYIKKYHKRIYDLIKSKTNAKIFHHSCGSVYDLIPGLLEAGVDILNPVQTRARHMEPERLKTQFGKDLVFWGGLDIQKLLPFGTPVQISEEVKRLMEIMGKGGGYVFSPSHNIQALVPPQNIDSMIKSAVKYRKHN